MAVEDPILCNCRAHCVVTITLAWDIQKISVANYVSPSSSYYCQAIEDKFMEDCIHIHLQPSLMCGCVQCTILKCTLLTSTYSYRRCLRSQNFFQMAHGWVVSSLWYFLRIHSSVSIMSLSSVDKDMMDIIEKLCGHWGCFLRRNKLLAKAMFMITLFWIYGPFLDVLNPQFYVGQSK